MKIVLAVVGVLVVAAAGALFWLGAFGAVQVVEREMGPYQFVYVQEASDDAGRIDELTEALGARLETAGYRQRRPAQVYYPAGRGIQNQIGFLVDRAVGNDVLGANTFFRPISVQRYMVVRFPHRAPLSAAIGRGRAEAALREHRAAKKYAETSTMTIEEDEHLLFLQPIAPG